MFKERGLENDWLRNIRKENKNNPRFSTFFTIGLQPTTGPRAYKVV